LSGQLVGVLANCPFHDGRWPFK